MMIPVTVDKDAQAFDIPSMREMTEEGYKNYVAFDIMFVDHHDILRAAMGEYPIATTERQVRILIEHLEQVAERMKAAEG